MTDETANPVFYDADSCTYDDQRWVSPGGALTNRRQQCIVDRLTSDWHGSRVLEVGPGTARFSVPLAKKNNRMTLLDISAEMLDVAKAKIESEGVGDKIEQYVEGSIYELPFPDASFDHAITLNVVNHLEKAGEALRELTRVITPGATLLFNYPSVNSFYFMAGRRINRAQEAIGQKVYSRWERPAEMRRMIDEAGLRLVKTVGHAHVPRALEKYRLVPLVAMLDSVCRAGPLKPLAPVQYCLCRKA